MKSRAISPRAGEISVKTEIINMVGIENSMRTIKQTTVKMKTCLKEELAIVMENLVISLLVERDIPSK